MKRGIFITLALVLVLSLLLIPQSATRAQSEPTDTPTPIVYPTVILPTDKAPSMSLFPVTPGLDQLERGENISFRVLEAKDFAMIGPYASYYLPVGIPSHWNLSRAAKLTLKVNLNVTRSPTPNEKYKSWVGPRLDIDFDDTYVTSYRIVNNGDYTFEIPLPVDRLKMNREGAHYLYLYMDAAYDCEFDQSSVLTIKADSFFTLPHDTARKTPNLNTLPVPFFQASSFLPNQVALVVPDNPSETELQAALTVAAGLGRITTNKLQLTALPYSQLTDAIRKSAHMIFVGKAGSIPYLSSLDLPAPLDGSQFKAAEAQADDGIIQTITSKSNPEKAVLVIGGNSEAGLLKAAQALSTGVVRATRNSRLAVISNVEPKNIASTNVAIDRSFAELGYENVTLQGLGLVSREFLFTLPGGFDVGDDAYLDFSYARSSLLDFDRSSISISLNGEMINSAPYSKADVTASSTPFRFSLPAYAFVPGVNTLVVETNHVNDYCAYDNTGEIWTTIYNKSTLHLPPSKIVEKKEVIPNFANYPRPFSHDPELSLATFLVGRNDPSAIFTASKIAEDLGRQSRGGIVSLHAYFSDKFPAEEKSANNLVLVGKPVDLPLIQEMAEVLPASFAAGSNIADESGLSVSYRMPPETSIGYMEILKSPWNTDRIIMAALGSTEEGLKWAGTALTDPTFVTQLSGDYAVTNGVDIYTVDTQAGSGTMNIAITAAPNMAVTVTPVFVAASSGSKPAETNSNPFAILNSDPKLWVPYAIIIITIITVAVVILLVLVNIKRKRDEDFRLRKRSR